jgi:hypothetical protein
VRSLPRRRTPVEAVTIQWIRLKGRKRMWYARKRGLRLRVRPHYTGLWIGEVLNRTSDDYGGCYEYLYSALFRRPGTAKNAVRAFCMNGMRIRVSDKVTA